MRKRQPSLPLYRALLKLYPKMFRQEYGEQMVQTLMDMLDDHPDPYERVAVWIRVSSDLPLSIVQENMNNIGGGAMNKLTKISNKQLLMGGGMLAILVLLAAATWGRGFIVSNVARLFYLKPVQQKVIDEDVALANPFQVFDASTPNRTSSCHILAVDPISTQVECLAAAHGTMSLSDKKDETIQKAQALEAALEKQGYRPGSNGVTVTSLIAGTYEGKDYSPDAFYQKVDGQHMCIFDTTIAYANPAPKAISMQLSCSRTIEILGRPSDATYRSSEGYL